MAGKGSKPRPIHIPEAEYAQRWEMAFNSRPLTDQENEAINRIVDEALEAGIGSITQIPTIPNSMLQYCP